LSSSKEASIQQESKKRFMPLAERLSKEARIFSSYWKNIRKRIKVKVLKMLAFLLIRSASGLKAASIKETARIYVGTPVSTGRTAGFIRPDITTQPGPDESGPTDRINPVFHIISPAEVDARSSLDSSEADSPVNPLTH